MNFYKRWIGDYRSKTARLTPLEHGVYNLLLDEHYATEEPLPLEKTELFQIIGARTPADEASVDKILKRYWIETKSGWTNARALEEMAAFRDKSTKASGAAHKRWESERNANAPANASETHMPAIATSHSQTPEPQPEPTSCAESLSRSTPDGPEIIRLPLAKSGEEAVITQPQVDEWAKAYPGVDIPQQLRHMRQWLLANQTKRKTHRGLPRFIVSWLSKAQDAPRGGTGRGATDNSAALAEALDQIEQKERTIDG